MSFSEKLYNVFFVPLFQPSPHCVCAWEMKIWLPNQFLGVLEKEKYFSEENVFQPFIIQSGLPITGKKGRLSPLSDHTH
jgi:hypothetical protein